MGLVVLALEGAVAQVECPAHSSVSDGGDGAACVCDEGYAGLVVWSALRGDYVSSCADEDAGNGAAGQAMTSVHQGWGARANKQGCYPSCATASQQYARTTDDLAQPHACPSARPPHTGPPPCARPRTHGPPYHPVLCPPVRLSLLAHPRLTLSLRPGSCTGRSRCSSQHSPPARWCRWYGLVASPYFGRCSRAPRFSHSSRYSWVISSSSAPICRIISPTCCCRSVVKMLRQERLILLACSIPRTAGVNIRRPEQ